MAIDNSRTVDMGGNDLIVNSISIGASGNGIPSATTTCYIGSGTPVSINTAGAVTYTAAQLLSGVIVRDTNGAGRTDVLPTAALLVAGINAVGSGAKVGDRVECLLINGADAAETLTLNNGSGGTDDANDLRATKTIGQNASKMITLRLTNVTAGSEAYVRYLN